MTTICLDAADDLSGAIRAAVVGTDAYLTLRDGGGQVLWSHRIDQWSTDGCQTTVRTRPVSELIDSAVESHAACQRAVLVSEAREKGIL